MIRRFFNFSEMNKLLVFRMVFVHLVIIAISNWAVQFNANLFGLNFTWGMFIFPIVLVATDLTVRISNPYNARGVVALATIPAIFVSAFLANWRIGLASAFAYLVSQLLDVSVFQRIREKFSNVWWVAPGVSAVCANVIDTYLFFWAAFAGGSDPFMNAHWPGIATTTLAFKIATSLAVFLPIYGVLLSFILNRLRRKAVAVT